MTRYYCLRCHHPMKTAGRDGMGPRCAAKAGRPAIVSVERDLFGFDVPAAARAAVERVTVHVQQLAVEAHVAVQHQFAAARRRLGVWA